MGNSPYLVWAAVMVISALLVVGTTRGLNALRRETYRQQEDNSNLANIFLGLMLTTVMVGSEIALISYWHQPGLVITSLVIGVSVGAVYSIFR